MNDDLDTILTEAAGNIVEPTEVKEDVAEPATEPAVEEPVAEEPVTEVKTETKPNPMKEVRARLNSEQKAKEKIEKTVQRFTDGDYNFKIRDFRTEDGKVDYDALSKAMDEADLKVKAEERGISPEVQAEIERIEKEKIELQRERLRVSMDRAIANMQTEMNLKNDEISLFFKDALAVKKNPYQWLAQGGALNDLYYLVYREKLVKSEIDKAVEEAKAKWEQATNKKAPTTNPAASTRSAAPTSGMSLNDLLEAAIK